MVTNKRDRDSQFPLYGSYWLPFLDDTPLALIPVIRQLTDTALSFHINGEYYTYALDYTTYFLFVQISLPKQPLAVWRHLQSMRRRLRSVRRRLRSVWRHLWSVRRHLLSMWRHFRIPGWMFETFEMEACHDRKLPHRQLLRGFLNKNINFHYTEKAYQLFRKCSIAVVKQ